MDLEGLRQHLSRFDHLPGDTPVVLAKDAEGNGFSPAADFELAMYAAETEWSGDHYMTEEQRLAEDDPEDYSPAPDDAVPAIFLWPTN